MEEKLLKGKLFKENINIQIERKFFKEKMLREKFSKDSLIEGRGVWLLTVLPRLGDLLMARSRLLLANDCIHSGRISSPLFLP